MPLPSPTRSAGCRSAPQQNHSRCQLECPCCCRRSSIAIATAVPRPRTPPSLQRDSVLQQHQGRCQSSSTAATKPHLVCVLPLQHNSTKATAAATSQAHPNCGILLHCSRKAAATAAAAATKPHPGCPWSTWVWLLQHQGRCRTSSSHITSPPRLRATAAPQQQHGLPKKGQAHSVCRLPLQHGSTRPQLQQQCSRCHSCPAGRNRACWGQGCTATTATDAAPQPRQCNCQRYTARNTLADSGHQPRLTPCPDLG
jgi:hypothetical protein